MTSLSVNGKINMVDASANTLFASKRMPSFYLMVNKGDLYGFNLMSEYLTKEINHLLNSMLLMIHTHCDLFGISGFFFQEGQPESEKAFLIGFYGEKDKVLRADLLYNVFNKYMGCILSENTLKSAIKKFNSDVFFEKIILEESIYGTVLENK